jgi:hypothetical protein
LVDNAVAINAEVLNKKYARQVGLKNLRDLYNWQLELITMEGKD